MIYNKDFRTGLKELNIQNIKLVVTSPPYFDARDYGGHSLFNDSREWRAWCAESILMLFNHMVDNGVVWWNTGSGYRNHHKMIEVYEDREAALKGF